ncbi:hypothetical protein FRB96_001779 [Tulasnella sp. 330]|nr:hypothetical protein FRB96_001779 [Tulasnella sp. 330]
MIISCVNMWTNSQPLSGHNIKTARNGSVDEIGKGRKVWLRNKKEAISTPSALSVVERAGTPTPPRYLPAEGQVSVERDSVRIRLSRPAPSAVSTLSQHVCSEEQPSALKVALESVLRRVESVL